MVREHGTVNRIGYVRNNRTLKANCLKLRPRWMWRERGVIGDIPLHALMIPGSHNAGAYKITDVSPRCVPETHHKKRPCVENPYPKLIVKLRGFGFPVLTLLKFLSS